ncbi:MAG TPA: response regulator transcription factor [Ilumatobacteraceae bacterium]|nr:response regulator transcription factor [Ilumatobacteraceae bacterium]
MNAPLMPCRVLLVHDRTRHTTAGALDPITIGSAAEVTEVPTVLEALDIYASEHFDIVVVGRPATNRTAADAVRQLRHAAPHMTITVIVDPLDPRAVADALHAGATGVLSDGVSAHDAASLVQIAARGTAVVDGRAAGSLASAWLPGSHDPLSTRESEVLQRLASGATNAAIAAELYLSRETVKSHVARLLRKIGAPDRGAAVDKARRLGLLGVAEQTESAVT